MKEWAKQRWFGRLVSALSLLHILLALNFFPLVPFLGWLNTGRSQWIDWLPDRVLLQLLPAGYYLYWHFWYLFALPPLVGSWLLCYRSRGNRGCWLLPANLTGLIIFFVVRLTLMFLGVRPDIAWSMI